MPGDVLTSEELLSYALNGGAMPPKYVNASPASIPGPAGWRLLDADHISTGIMDPNRLGTGSTGAGNLYLADDGTWKVISGAPGVGDMLKATYDVDNDGTVDSAERIEIIVRNSTGSTLTKGQVVYLSGATGNRPNAVLSKADTEATSSKTFGIVVQDIANNSDGYVACNGTLHDLDTSAFADGAALWLSATTAGAYTSTIPAEPNHTVFIGYVARSHPTQGRLVILIQNGYELNELHGVLISAEANNDLLVYESSSTLWKNKSISTIFGGTPLVSVPTLAQVTTAGNTTTNAITVGGLVVDTNVLVVDSVNNRVGVGTSSPTTPLDVNGRTRIAANSGPVGAIGGTSYGLSIQNNAAYSWLEILNNGGAGKGAFFGMTTNDFELWNYQGGPINFYTSTTASTGTVRLIIANDGNVLIGTSTNAGYKLDVAGNTRVNGGNTTSDIPFIVNNRFQFRGDGVLSYGAASAHGRLNWDASGAYFYGLSGYGVGLGANGVLNHLFINTSGNVGIGTTSPTYRLDVQGTTLAASSVRVQGSFDVNPLAAPPAIGGFTLSAGTNLGVGTYYYFVVYVTALGETSAGANLTVVTTTGNTTVNLTGIPVSSDPRVTARKIYRTTVGQTSDAQKFLATINDNVTTTYTDSATDASLTGVALQYYKVNTTARYFTVSGVQGMVIDSNLTALGRNAGNAIIASSGAAIRTVLIGAQAGQNITTGQANVIVGVAGGNLTTGGNNALFGDVAGYNLTTGYDNTILGGDGAGRYIIAGIQNVIIGAQAARNLADGTTQVTGGSNNTVIGVRARMSTISDTNAIIIGHTALGLGSNTTVIGNSSTTFTSIPAGNMTVGGTTNAGYKFDVQGTLRTINDAYFATTSGNVGIGTTTPQTKLHIGPLTGGNGTAQERLRLSGDWSTTGSGALLRFTNQHDSGTNPNAGEYNLAGIAGVDDNGSWGGALYFYTAPQGTAGGANLNTRMVISSQGNVGIGTTSPGEKLQVAGNLHISGVGSALYFDTDASPKTIVQYVNNLYELHIYNGRGITSRIIGGNSFVSLGSGTTQMLYLNTSSGNVLIGTTTDGGYKLDVNGSSRATSFVKTGGTSSQFLKADGSVDSNAYITSAGNAATATTLQTARNINGTSFNGSADITTAVWGNARTLTIGNTGKSVNGSGNVSWTLGEIQAEYQVPNNTLRSNLGDPTVREAAMFHGQFNNKFRFISPTLQEESADGITWTTSTRASAATLGDMMRGEGEGTSFSAIPTGTIGVYDGYRLTWNVVGTVGYVFLNALYVYNSTNGNNVTIKIEAYHNTNGWVTITGPHTTNSWPGHAYIPHSPIYYSNNASQYSQVRITFETTRNAFTNAFTIYSIEWVGGYPAGKRNAESYDRLKNVTFPADISSPGNIRSNNGTVNNILSWTSEPAGVIGTTTNHPLAFWTNNTERMRITAAGNVGIGTTSPGSKLAVLNTANTVAAIIGGGTATPGWVGIGTVNSGALPFIQGYNNAVNVANTISLNPSGGNVLIGTATDAGYKLDVTGTLRSTGQATLAGLLAQRSDTIENVITISQNGSAAAAHLYSLGDGYLGWVGHTAAVSRRFAFESALANSGRNFGLYIYDSAGSNPTQVFYATKTDFYLGNTVNTNGSITAASAVARGVYISNTLVATANNDILVGLDVQPTYTLGSFTGVARYAARINGITTVGNATSTGARTDIGLNVVTNVDNSALSVLSTAGTSLHLENINQTTNSYVNLSLRTSDSGSAVYTNLSLIRTGAATGSLRIHQQGTQQFALFTSGNLVLQNGGTFTDAGYRLDVNGTARVQGSITATLANTTAANVVYYNSSTGLLTYGTAPVGAQFVIDYDYNIVGVKNGVNVVFTTSANFITTTTRVFLNGQRLTRGVGYDYVETGTNQVTFANPLNPTDLIIIEYQI